MSFCLNLCFETKKSDFRAAKHLNSIYFPHRSEILQMFKRRRSVDLKEARANVRILVGPRTDPKRQFKRPHSKNSTDTGKPGLLSGPSKRSRRDLGNDIVLTLKENHPLGLIGKVGFFFNSSISRWVVCHKACEELRYFMKYSENLGNLQNSTM